MVQALARTAMLGLTVVAISCTDTSVEEGAVLFARHCAACHGSDGRGRGPMADHLEKAPSDLTRLAQRAGGRFDASYVFRVIDGQIEVEEHGPRVMPVWGEVFEEELTDYPHAAERAVPYVQALTDYLESIQVEN